jgi:hypothetical protein
MCWNNEEDSDMPIDDSIMGYYLLSVVSYLSYAESKIPSIPALNKYGSSQK